MSNHDALIDRYIESWNTEGAARRRLIAETWTEGGAYVDPVMKSDGHAGLDEMIEGVRARFPGFVMRRQGGVDAHNDRVRFSWTLGPNDGDAPIAGIDVGQIGPDGRFVSIVGFIDRAPGM